MKLILFSFDLTLRKYHMSIGEGADNKDSPRTTSGSGQLLALGVNPVMQGLVSLTHLPQMWLDQIRFQELISTPSVRR